jgi:hypothetical protein
MLLLLSPLLPAAGRIGVYLGEPLAAGGVRQLRGVGQEVGVALDRLHLPGQGVQLLTRPGPARPNIFPTPLLVTDNKIESGTITAPILG